MKPTFPRYSVIARSASRDEAISIRRRLSGPRLLRCARNDKVRVKVCFFLDVADVRQHLLAEEFERFHQLVGIFRARGLERQIDDAAADLSAGLFQLRDDLVRTAAEVDRQRPVVVG